MKMRFWIPGCCFWLMWTSAIAVDPPFLSSDTKWADSVIATLTPRERIAQLFMIPVYPEKGEEHILEITSLIEKYGIGGLIFMKGNPTIQAHLTNYFQFLSKTPLLIAMDAEWGLAMRLDSIMNFPYQMTLGAVSDDSIVYETGAAIALQCRRLGVHLNFAPVADINSNPDNPVIGYRSFGEDKYNVTRKAIAFMKGIQDNGVIACAKHFPGHGDTHIDSHLALPVIKHAKKRLDSVEFFPFRELIKAGVGSVMTAHLHVPVYDGRKNVPASLSEKITKDLLKKSMGFNGLIVTDALNMKGVVRKKDKQSPELKALLAGNDILLFPDNVDSTIVEIEKAIASGKISQQEIDSRCKKILLAKQWVGLNHYNPVQMENIVSDINNRNTQLLVRKITEASLTLLENKKKIIPPERLDTLKIAVIDFYKKEEKNISEENPSEFYKSISRYATAKYFFINDLTGPEERKVMTAELKQFNLIISGIHGNNKVSDSYGISQSANDLISEIQKQSSVISVFFTNPYAISKNKFSAGSTAIIVAYEDNNISQDIAVQLIFGGTDAKGTLPVRAGKFSAGKGISTNGSKRLKYTIPEELGINSKYLERVDSIANSAILQKVMPGCQILAAKEGKVFYHKSFGTHIYKDTLGVIYSPDVGLSDIYDIASVTKMAATAISLIKLQKEGKLHIDSSLKYFFPVLPDTSDKKNITLREILSHHSRFHPWIPFWMMTTQEGAVITQQGKYIVNDNTLSDTWYRNEWSHSFANRVAENLFIRNDYRDTINELIFSSALKEKREYLYSDLGYYLIHHIIESFAGMTLEDYVYNNFYRPLGLNTIGYHPRQRFPQSRIIPTEIDTAFRKQLIHGDVHDPGAAMTGGVGAHAGLFSDANDLGVLMQMLIQGGEYAGVRYLDSALVREFTGCQFCNENNRRGAGFDRPELAPDKDGPTCKCVSPLSFGHTGFTGTMAWADPESKVVFVFLSNRVYPYSENNKLATMGIRTLIQEAIYDAIR